MPADDDVTAGEDPGRVDADESWFVLRPLAGLMDLSFAHRWEVTRRHPYYLRFWELARRHYDSPGDDPGQRGLESSAALVLQSIGVVSSPPPPVTTAAELTAGPLAAGWESGAVAPVMLRGLVGLLLVGLPPDAQIQVGRLFTDTGTSTAEASARSHEALEALGRLRHPALDAVPDAPVVGVNVKAPQRAILAAVERMVREWKRRKDIPERRRRDDKLEDYLTVWDLREGWTADHYEGDREKSLREIAALTKAPLSTVVSRYRSAFRLIVGRDYTPALWVRVLGPHKLHEWLEPHELPRRALRRRWKEPQPRDVPESALQGPGEGGGAGLISTLGVSDDEIASVDFLLDVRELIERRCSTAEIIAELELKPPGIAEVIDSFRRRHDERL